MELIQTAVLTCPYCEFKQTVDMPVDAYQRLYRCTNCHVSLIPRVGDCCVFCSYANVKCPPKQNEEREP